MNAVEVELADASDPRVPYLVNGFEDWPILRGMREGERLRLLGVSHRAHDEQETHYREEQGVKCENDNAGDREAVRRRDVFRRPGAGASGADAPQGAAGADVERGHVGSYLGFR